MCRRTLAHAVLPLALCLAAPVPFAAAADYFVATHGDDANPGTEAKPWKTPQKASNSVQPGDTVRIGAGSYSPVKGTWTVRCAGTAEAPITFKARGDGAVRISTSSVLPADGWKPHKGAIYQIEVGSPVMAVFQNGLPLVNPWKNHNLTSVETMYANSFYKKGSTLYVWLADGADPRTSRCGSRPARDCAGRLCPYHFRRPDRGTRLRGIQANKGIASRHHTQLHPAVPTRTRASWGRLSTSSSRRTCSRRSAPASTITVSMPRRET